MNIYDGAHALARALKESDEFIAYEAAKQAAFENETNKTLIQEYKKLQMKLQVAAASGVTPDAEAMDRLQKIASLLQFSPECAAYLYAEVRVQKMLADIFKILGDAAGLDLDLLQA